MRTAFILYNKALHEIQTGHDDAAKNYLRKAVVIFPEFYDAIMVLGILTFANGDRIGAVRIFNSVKNLEQRAISIGILDHLVEEAERPETARVLGTQKFSSERGKAESVMGGRTSASSRSNRRRQNTAKARFLKKAAGITNRSIKRHTVQEKYRLPQTPGRSAGRAVRRSGSGYQRCALIK